MEINRMIITSTTIFILLLFFTPQSESRIYNYNILEVSLSFGLPSDLQKALDLNSHNSFKDEKPYNYTPAAFKTTGFHICYAIRSILSQKSSVSTFTMYSDTSQRPPPLFSKLLTAS